VVCVAATACSAAPEDGADSTAGAVEGVDAVNPAEAPRPFDSKSCGETMGTDDLAALVRTGEKSPTLGKYDAKFRRQNGKGPWLPRDSSNGVDLVDPSGNVVSKLEYGDLIVELNDKGLPTVSWGTAKGSVRCSTAERNGDLICSAKHPESPSSKNVMAMRSGSPVTKIEATLGRKCAWLHGVSEAGKDGSQSEFAFQIRGKFFEK
jgi:hypothetical protein